MVIADDFNAQRGYLMETEQHLGGRFYVPADSTDNQGRFTQVRKHRHLP